MESLLRFGIEEVGNVLLLPGLPGVMTVVTGCVDWMRMTYDFCS